jgi:hydroxymethylpyrimidine/phosphomethylpyrimidine kinase
MIPRALTIAGSDSGGGAGIQADLKTFAALGAYGMTAVTAVTAQNTVGVQGIQGLPPEFVGAQIDSVADDIGVDAAKTGMLLNSEIIAVVADRVEKHGIENLVVDPVMISKSGAPLLQSDARQALASEMLPLARVVTPNLHEAAALVGFPVDTLEDMRRAAAVIHQMGPQNVVVKGGHLEGDSIDLLYDGQSFTQMIAPRVATKNSHGTGCTFASAIAAGLAEGLDVPSSVRRAKAYITIVLLHSLDIGQGYGPTDHLAILLGRASWDEVSIQLRSSQ